MTGMIVHEMGTFGIDRLPVDSRPGHLRELQGIQARLKACPPGLNDERRRALAELGEYYWMDLHRVGRCFCDNLMAGQLPHLLAAANRRELIEAFAHSSLGDLPMPAKRALLAPIIGIVPEARARELVNAGPLEWRAGLAFRLMSELGVFDRQDNALRRELCGVGEE